MKLALSSLIAAVVLVIAAPVLAAPPPVEVVYKAKNGDVTFPHKEHQKQGCKSCHTTPKPEKIAIEGKDAAHKFCQGCHEEKQKGPQKTECVKCHKKAQ